MNQNDKMPPSLSMELFRMWMDSKWRIVHASRLALLYVFVCADCNGFPVSMQSDSGLGSSWQSFRKWNETEMNFYLFTNDLLYPVNKADKGTFCGHCNEWNM